MVLWPCASLATSRVARAMDLKLGTARWPYGFVRDARPTSWLGNTRRACGCGRDRTTTRPDSPWHHFSTRIGANITFDKVAREWRCKYAADASGGPADSASLKAAEELLQSYLPTLKALPNAEVTRVMCGGCHDFKIVVNRRAPRRTQLQRATPCSMAWDPPVDFRTEPCADHDAWKASDYAPEQEFIAKLSAIEGVSQVETQEYTCQPL